MTMSSLLLDRIPTAATAPNDIISDIRDRLPPPSDAVARRRFDAIADDLGRLDGHLAADRLERPIDRFGGVYLQAPIYSLIVLAAGAFADGGIALPGGERLLHAVRWHIRGELALLPMQISSLWIIPVQDGDRAAAHLASLHLTRLGETARPWLWKGVPDRGRFMLIGLQSSPEAIAACPLISDPRCAGILCTDDLIPHPTAF